MNPTSSNSDILRLADVDHAPLKYLLQQYGLSLSWVDEGQAIPGSYWGDEEAGLIGHTVYVRTDTPVHSLLHESCHAICMGARRREQLHTDADGDDAEENAVCYLQLMLAEQLNTQIPSCHRLRMCQDMDNWGYSFRLGSTLAWFEQDAEDARLWLEQAGLLPLKALKEALI